MTHKITDMSNSHWLYCAKEIKRLEAKRDKRKAQLLALMAEAEENRIRTEADSAAMASLLTAASATADSAPVAAPVCQYAPRTRLRVWRFSAKLGLRRALPGVLDIRDYFVGDRLTSLYLIKGFAACYYRVCPDLDRLEGVIRFLTPVAESTLAAACGYLDYYPAMNPDYFAQRDMVTHSLPADIIYEQVATAGTCRRFKTYDATLGRYVWNK